jgi:hypothetical protein
MTERDRKTIRRIAERLVADGLTVERVRDEITGFALNAAEECLFCGQKATLLCDYTIGIEKAGTARGTGGRPYNYATAGGEYSPFPDKRASEMFTCDAPMCEKCSTFINCLFLNPGGAETVDYCKYHAQRTPLTREPVITALEAERERKKIRREIARYVRDTRGVA